MSDVTASQLALLRTHPQQVELSLSIYKPNTILACRVNDATIARGARSITYDTVSSGSYTKVVSGQTMWVGSTAGARDKGKIRVRSATSTVITVAENSDIDWANDLYLTVIDVIDIVPIFPRIIQNPSNLEETIWYKDYDIAYSDQNQNLGSFICMGPHRAGDLDSSGEAKFYFSASGTVNPVDDDLSYLWEFPGAFSVTGSVAETPGWVTWKTAGDYAAKLTVTSGNGAVDYSYRYVSVRNSATKSKDWEIVSGQGSRGAGGYTATIRINKPYQYEIYEGAIVVIYANEWYGNTNTNLGGNSENNSKIYFVGYILNGSILWDFEKSSVEFQVVSVSDIMKATNGFAISLEGVIDTPTTWYQMRHNSVIKSIYHFLRWHSTVLMVTDLQVLLSDVYCQYFDSDRTSVFDAVNNFLQKALMAELVCDFQGKLWVETSMMATHLAKTFYTPKFTLNKNDWLGEPTIQELFYNQVSYLEVGGVVYSPLSPDNPSTAILAGAPGATPALHGKVEAPTGLALTSQTQLNQLAGDLFAYKNAKKPNITMDMRGAYKNLDIAPHQVIQVEIAAEDTSRNVAVSNPYFVDTLNFTYSGQDSYLRTGITLREITEGIIGETIIIPVNPPTDVPPINIVIPQFPFIWTPPPIIFPPVVIPWVSPGILAIFVDGSTDNRLWYTTDLSSGSPKWIAATTDDDWTADELASITRFKMNRWGRCYLVGRDDGLDDPANTWIYSLKIGDPGRIVVADNAYFVAQGSLGTLTIKAFGIDYTNDKNIAVWLAQPFPPSNRSMGFIANGADTLTRTLLRTSFYFNELSGDIAIYNGKIYVTAGVTGSQDRYLLRFPSAFTYPAENSELIGNAQAGGWQAHATEADYNYVYPNGDLVTDNGETVVRATAGSATLDNRSQSMACDPTGQYAMRSITVSGGEISYSSDYGATWTTRTSFPHHHAIVNSSTRILNLGTALDWIVAYNQSPSVTLNIQITNDGGVTWRSVIGNLLDYADDDSGCTNIWYA